MNYWPLRSFLCCTNSLAIQLFNKRGLLTSRKLQFVIVTHSTPAFFIRVCITANLFLSLSNAYIFLTSKQKKTAD